jgi:hypothetical protein
MARARAGLHPQARGDKKAAGVSTTGRQRVASTAGEMAILTVSSKHRVRHPDSYPWSTTLECGC